MMGDRTSLFEMTCMRNASAIDLFKSCLYNLDMSTSPLLLYMNSAEIIYHLPWLLYCDEIAVS